MRKVAVAFMFAVVAGSALIVRPVLAQEDHVQKYREEDKEKTPAQQEADKRAARAYQRSLNAVPDQKPVDPWGIARPDNTPKAPAKKTAAPKQAKPASAAAN